MKSFMIMLFLILTLPFAKATESCKLVMRLDPVLNILKASLEVGKASHSSEINQKGTCDEAFIRIIKSGVLETDLEESYIPIMYTYVPAGTESELMNEISLIADKRDLNVVVEEKKIQIIANQYRERLKTL